VLDPDDPETWGGKKGQRCYIDEELLNGDGVWTCPHDPKEGEDLCIFHQPVKEKDDKNVVEDFIDVLEETINQDSYSLERQLQFIGGQFGEFDLSEHLPEVVAEDAEIVLSYATVKGALNWSETVFEVSGMRMRGTKCIGDSIFRSVDFGGEADFGGVEFGGKADFGGADFGGEAGFYRADFSAEADFGGADFGGEADFGRVEFGGEADFGGADFGEKARFRRAEFGGGANFRMADFGGDIDFGGAEFSREAHFVVAEFGGEAGFGGVKFGGVASFTSAEFGREVDFYNAEFDGETNFDGVDFKKGVRFSKTTFDEGPDFSSFESLADSQFGNADLTDADFTGVTLHNADFEKALLSRATLFGADFRGAKLAGTVIGDVRIDQDTQFLGHPDDDNSSSPHTYSAIRSKPRCVYDPKHEEDHEAADVDKAKSVYRALEELAGKAARPRLQSQCFVRRQDLQKDDYKRVMLAKTEGPESEKESTEKKEGTGNGEGNIESEDENPSFEERLIAGVRYIRAKVARITLLYGESPWRIIGISSVFIFTVGVVYPIFGWLQPREESNPITWTRILDGEPILLLESLYFSALTFTTLGMGDYEPVGGGGQALVTFNTAFGAILIALLVFVFGRRAAK